VKAFTGLLDLTSAQLLDVARHTFGAMRTWLSALSFEGRFA
jgi:hypothetical protein